MILEIAITVLIITVIIKDNKLVNLLCKIMQPGELSLRPKENG